MHLPFRRRRTMLPLPEWARNTVENPRDALAWLPLDSQGVSWLIATRQGLLILQSHAEVRQAGSSRPTPAQASAATPSMKPVETSLPSPVQTDAELLAWDRISRGQWDAEERLLTLTILGAAQPRVLAIPGALHRVVDGRHISTAVDDADFSRVLRQQVESASVFHRSHYLKELRGGLSRVELYVRRRPSGELYVCSEPTVKDPRLSGLHEEIERALQALADSVGLHTQ